MVVTLKGIQDQILIYDDDDDDEDEDDDDEEEDEDDEDEVKRALFMT